MVRRTTYAPPARCPTCGEGLRVSALACGDCGTEMHGRFHRCEFCSLTDAQRSLLRVFLAARGNTKELERHLGVSYPTARARLDDLLAALGIVAPAGAESAGDGDPKARRRQLLDAVAAGEVPVDEAVETLARRGRDRGP